MRLQITDEAIRCLKEDWDFVDGEFVKIYVRYAGGGGDPYKIGILKETPDEKERAGITETAGGITFFMDEEDFWILEGGNLTIDAKGEDIQFIVEEK